MSDSTGDNYGHPFKVVCHCRDCELGIYDDELGIIRCPVCFGHLRPSLNVEDDSWGGYWGGLECQGVCGITWTDFPGKARPTPAKFESVWLDRPSPRAKKIKVGDG